MSEETNYIKSIQIITLSDEQMNKLKNGDYLETDIIKGIKVLLCHVKHEEELKAKLRELGAEDADKGIGKCQNTLQN